MKDARPTMEQLQELAARAKIDGELGNRRYDLLNALMENERRNQNAEDYRLWFGAKVRVADACVKLLDALTERVKE